MAVMKQILSINSTRFKRYMATSPSCDLRTEIEKYLLHMLHNCPYASSLWSELNPLDRPLQFISTNLADWLQDNLRSTVSSDDGTQWRVRFSVACWLLWRWLNDKIFSSKIQFRSAAQVISISKEFFRVSNLLASSMSRQQVVKLINWKPPNEGVVN